MGPPSDKEGMRHAIFKKRWQACVRRGGPRRFHACRNSKAARACLQVQRPVVQPGDRDLAVPV